MEGRAYAGIERERAVQGPAWDSVHLGYFSDPRTAGTLVGAARRRAAESRPETIADIGGGTGFILGELARSGLDPAVDLVNLDISTAQLAAVRHRRIRRIVGSIDSFRRKDLAAGDGEILFLMRSVLHYLGREKLEPALSHIRSQMKRGEYFIHQSACFEDPAAAGCLSAIYAKMGTIKRYPAAGELAEKLAEAGFTVRERLACPALVLASADLGSRYGLGPAEMDRIGGEVAGEFGVRAGVFEAGTAGWTAWLHYRIFITRAE